MNIYKLYIRYLHSALHSNAEIGRLNHSYPGAGDTDLSVTFIAYPAEYLTLTLYISASKQNRYSLCFICGGL